MLLWRGFEYRWRFTSHRLPVLGTWVEDTDPPRHRFTLRIGAFPPDRADVATHAVRLDESQVRLVARGRVEMTVKGHLSWPARAEVRRPREDWMERVRDPGPSGDLPDGHELVAVLDGFELRALRARSGWNVGHLGLDVSLDGTDLVCGAHLRPAESPHPGIFGLGAWRWDEDAAHAVTVGYAVLAVPTGSVQPLDAVGGDDSTLFYELDAWEGASVTPSATALLRGFDVALDAPPRLRRRSGYLRNLNGRYLRRLAVAIASGPDGDTPLVAIGNRPHPLIRAGALTLQYAVFALAVFAAVSDPTQRLLAVLVLLFLAALTWAWPTVWFQAPAVPFEVRARLRAVRLAARGEAVRLDHLHVPDEDATTLG